MDKIKRLYDNDFELTTLNLNSNNIGYTEVKSISEALKVNTVLTKLDLSYNNIGANGMEGVSSETESLCSKVKLISEALKVNTVLTELVLVEPSANLGILPFKR